MRPLFPSVFASLGLDPAKFLDAGYWIGFFVLVAVIFAESGIMVGFFLPGDSLLFAAGLFSYRGDLPNIVLISAACAVAAVAGDQVGYAFGKKVGPSLFTRPKSRLFKPEYTAKATEFFERHGPKAIVLARFVPVVRTFCPIVAGASDMHYRSFVKYNVIGGVAWAVGFTQLGFWIGKRFPAVGDNLDKAIIVIVLFSLVPIAIEFWRHRRKAKLGTESAVAHAETGETITPDELHDILDDPA